MALQINIKHMAVNGHRCLQIAGTVPIVNQAGWS